MAQQSRSFGINSLLSHSLLQRGLLWGVMIIFALLAFEIFNYSTTEFALSDLLGDLEFAGVRWATILALAFCGIDFAGIARLFTPEQGADEPAEVWYLFGAWLLAATMNAMLTWWGISIAILQHQSLGNAVVEREVLLKAVPIFVAIMVWLSRVLIIGTFSVAGERLFTQAEHRTPARLTNVNPPMRPPASLPHGVQTASTLPRPAFRPTAKPKPVPRPDVYQPPAYNPRPEPTYHPVGMQSRNNTGPNNVRR
ncbi:MAG: hypothetical protein Fur0022_34500 [Anaerolineales bacterium]